MAEKQCQQRALRGRRFRQTVVDVVCDAFTRHTKGLGTGERETIMPVSYTHLRAHET